MFGWIFSIGILAAVIFGFAYFCRTKGGFKKYIFCIFVSLCSGIIGFMIMNNKIPGKLMGATLFLSMAFGVSLFINLILTEAVEKKAVTVIVEVVLSALMLWAVLACGYKEYKPARSPYDDVFDKNPNNWTNDEKEYVNDFFDWMGDN